MWVLNTLVSWSNLEKFCIRHFCLHEAFFSYWRTLRIDALRKNRPANLLFVWCISRFRHSVSIAFLNIFYWAVQILALLTACTCYLSWRHFLGLPNCFRIALHSNEWGMACRNNSLVIQTRSFREKKKYILQQLVLHYAHFTALSSWDQPVSSSVSF